MKFLILVINHKVICRLRKIEQLLRHPLKNYLLD